MNAYWVNSERMIDDPITEIKLQKDAILEQLEIEIASDVTTKLL